MSRHVGSSMKRIRSAAVMAGFLVAVVALAPSQAVAQVGYGIFGVPSGNWTNASSWGATWDQYPFAGQARIGYVFAGAAAVCTATVDSASSVTHSSVRVGEQGTADGTIVLDGNLTTSGTTDIGVYGRGTVNQASGIWNNGSSLMYLGTVAGAEGTYNLSGDGVLTNLWDLFVGNNGVGAFNLSGGGTVAGIVSGTYIGNQTTSTGTVTQTGGTWDNNGKSLTLGNVAGAEGTYNLSGDGVLTNLWVLNVGNNGVGAFNLSGGGTVAGIVSATYIGDQPTSTGTVTQTGGTWDNNGKSLYVGNTGSGTYSISGGSLTNVDILIANNASGDHTLIVEGSSASINVNHIHMDTASPTLRVKPDATALSPINCSGQLHVNAATLEVDLSDYDGVGPLTLINYGTLNQWPFATVVTNTPGTGFEVDYTTGGAITLKNITGCLPAGTVVSIR
jgi:T5SS/PEP-CTERM-associated repeat protein